MANSNEASPAYGPNRQAEVYLRGLTDAGPGLPVSAREWEERARLALESGPFDYVAGGAGAESTMQANRAAFDRWSILPRMLGAASERKLHCTIAGTHFAAPFAPAPVGVLGIVHPDAERAPARAAAASGIPFILSTVSSVPIEAVAQEMGDAARWFQLYPLRDREVTASLVLRAEAAGFGAIVITVDTVAVGWRERDLRNRYLPFLRGEGMASILTDPVFLSRLQVPPQEALMETVRTFLTMLSNVTLDWDDIDAIRRLTDLPVFLKGILHPDDAREALQHGIDGIVVSNHGGRQVDGAVAALDALPGVCYAVGDQVPVLMDSGIRTGADVLKALALGARAVLLGRPYVYGLAVAGEEGVREVFDNLIAELDTLMTLCGIRTLDEIRPSLLARTAE